MLMNTYLISLLFFVVAGGAAFFANRQRVANAKIKNLPELSIDEAKEGDVGKFKGTADGTKVDVPYADSPLVYYKIKLMEREVKKSADGKTQVRWKPFLTRRSKDPFYIKGDKARLLIDPLKIGITSVEFYVGKALQWNKDLMKRMEFLIQASRKVTLGQKMKLNLRGIDYGRKILGVGKVVRQDGVLALVRDKSLGNIFPTTDTGEIDKKGKTLSLVFWGISGLSLITSVIALVMAIME